MTTLTTKQLGGLPIRKVEDRPAYLNIMIFGDPGIGKTVLAGSADAVPAMRPVLLLDVEGGSESLRRTYPQVDVIRVSTWRELVTVVNDVESMQHGYQTLVLDSLGESQKYSMYHILGQTVSENPDRDEDVAGMREWGKNLEQTRKLVRMLRDLPMNVIFTAHATSDRNQKTGVVTRRPALSGKAAHEVAGFLDIVLYMYTKEVPNEEGEGTKNLRLCLTGTTEEYVAKDRTGKLPLVIQDPTMLQIYNTIFETE